MVAVGERQLRFLRDEERMEHEVKQSIEMMEEMVLKAHPEHIVHENEADKKHELAME